MISSLTTMSLIVLHSRSLFSDKKIPVLIGVIMSLLWFHLYDHTIEDTALLIGSPGLFIILAAIMYFSGKIRWYLPEPA